MILDGSDRQSAVAVGLSNDSDLCTVILDRFLDESDPQTAARAVLPNESE